MGERTDVRNFGHPLSENVGLGKVRRRQAEGAGAASKSVPECITARVGRADGVAEVQVYPFMTTYGRKKANRSAGRRWGTKTRREWHGRGGEIAQIPQIDKRVKNLIASSGKCALGRGKPRGVRSGETSGYVKMMPECITARGRTLRNRRQGRRRGLPKREWTRRRAMGRGAQRRWILR